MCRPTDDSWALLELFSGCVRKNCGELDDATTTALKKLLPNPCMDIDYDGEEVEEVRLEAADVKAFGKGGATGGGGGAYDEDSDDERGGQGVQCQQS
ncbi:hypothetical protein TrCOL_g8067 [Triparma columacea]|uniref:Uncharacterized protein n=1 Tax=Triparma columacea TaxID=722753 RepID=A0A9W7LG11_9STRA|nr:hypothetical protein TrCOL_g8067 [Triparma columacea]